MPCDYAVDHPARMLTITGDGAVSMEERRKCVHRIMGDLSLKGKYHLLINMDRATVSPTADEIPLVSLLIDQLKMKLNGRVAIYNTRVGHVTTSHLVAHTANGISDRVKAFFDENEARNWLHQERIVQ